MEFVNQLLLQFSVNDFQTLHTNCGHIEDVHVGFLMELELILRDDGLLNLSFWQLFCNYSYNV